MDILQLMGLWFQAPFVVPVTENFIHVINESWNEPIISGEGFKIPTVKGESAGVPDVTGERALW